MMKKQETYLEILLSTLAYMTQGEYGKIEEQLEYFSGYISEEESESYREFLQLKYALGVLTKRLEGSAELQERIDFRTEAIAQLNKRLEGENDLESVATKALDFVVPYINASVATVYVYDEQRELLELRGSYALGEDMIKKTFRLGEGTVGQVAVTKNEICIDESLKIDMMVQTSYSQEKPKAVYTFGLLYLGKMVGVMELGSFFVFSEELKTLVRDLNLILAASVVTALGNGKVKSLLEESQKVNILLEEQQQQLEETNAQLEEQQQQLEEANSQMEEQQQQLEQSNVELNQLSEKLSEKNDVLQQNNKYKSEFLANMSHELRTPLNSIILLSDLLKENPRNNLSPNELKKAAIINSSGNELLRLINDILDLSKIESGKVQLQITKFNSSELVQEMQEQFEHIAKKKNIKLVIVDNFGGIVQSDRYKISQILKNFLSNAIKFTDQGYVKFFIEQENQEIVFRVKDSGIGIPTEKQKVIFDPFIQADGSSSREYGGTGLGLSICRELGKMLLGRIGLYSAVHEGSVFSLRIPMVRAMGGLKQNIVVKESEEKEQIKDDRNVLTHLEKPFLIVENKREFAQSVLDKLHEKNEKGIVLHQGKELLMYLVQNSQVKGILIDLELDDVDGVELLKQIKADVNHKKIPLYAISQKDMDGIVQFVMRVQNRKHMLGQSNMGVDLSGKRILIVDDDIRNIYVVSEALESRGAEVMSALNGLEALELLKKDIGVDLILMDIMMPVMNGYTAIRKIKQSNRKNIPIIALTAKAMREDKRKSLEVGADDYMAKPLNLEIFLGIVKAWVDRKRI